MPLFNSHTEAKLNTFGNVLSYLPRKMYSAIFGTKTRYCHKELTLIIPGLIHKFVHCH